MALIKDKDRREIGRLLAELAGDVRLLMFTQDSECQWCETTRNLVTEVAELSERLSVKVHDFAAEPKVVARYKIARIPAIVVLGDRDYGIRFYGIPAGYEFAAFMAAIRAAGRRDSGLEPDVLMTLAKVGRPVHMQVLVTPT
jgi:alkyl hydroperoxide reductase subunit AhpF